MACLDPLIASSPLRFQGRAGVFLFSSQAHPVPISGFPQGGGQSLVELRTLSEQSLRSERVTRRASGLCALGHDVIAEACARLAVTPWV